MMIKKQRGRINETYHQRNEEENLGIDGENYK